MEESRPRSSHKKSSSNIFFIIGTILIVVAVISLLIFFLRGESTTTGNYPEPESSESIACEAVNINYPVIDARSASRTATRATATFRDNTLISLALVYSLYYDTTDQIDTSLNINHPKINLATQSEGLGPDIFNLHFNKLSDRLELRLYANANQISPTSAKYLLLNTYPDNGIYTKSLIENIYQSAGLNCLVKE